MRPGGIVRWSVEILSRIFAEPRLSRRDAGAPGPRESS